MRKSTVKRVTKETSITATLVIEGKGRYDINTGIRFLDHMLELVAKHGGFDLSITAKGDLDIDQHHTVEDVGIVLGELFKKALGKKIGINRAGYFVLPMDETLVRASVDLCNRPYLIWKVSFTRDKVGVVDTELFKEFFHAFAMNAGVCLHLELLYGENSHHIAEASFKSLARALRAAAVVDDRLKGQVASTKGSL
jgi:imidazoleglycerol-phosphate dehydratase